MYMYVYINIYKYICERLTFTLKHYIYHICWLSYLYIYMCVYILRSIYTYIYIYIYVHKYASVCTYIYSYTHIYIHIIQDIRDAIPAHCFQRNLWTSLMHLASDLAAVFTLAYCASLIDQPYMPGNCYMCLYICIYIYLCIYI
jgi:hypothetical protein